MSYGHKRLPAGFLSAFLLLASVLVPGRVSGQSQAPVEINLILPMTGAMAFLGRTQQTMFQLEEKAINERGGIRGRPVKFVYADDESNPQTGVQLANGLIAKKVPAFVGSSLVSVCQAYMPLLAQAGPVDYCLAPPVRPPAGGYVFAAGATSEDLGATLLRYFRSRGLTRIAVITTTDATGHDVDEALTALFARPENKAITVVAYEHFAPSDISIAAQLARIKAARPQAIFAWTVGTPTGTLLRGIRDSGIDVPVGTSNGNMLYRQMAQYAGILPRELVFPTYRAITEGAPESKAVQSAQSIFFEALKSANARPDIASVSSWDAVMIVVDALRHAGPDASARQVRDFIDGQSHYAGINGIYDFRGGNQRGLNANQLVVDRWDSVKNAFVLISKPGGGT